MSLTNNAISELRNLTVMGNPLTVQVISLKSVTNNGSSSTRYRVIVSDGAHFMQGMLATQMNHLAENGTLQENSIIVIHDAISNDVAGKKIAIILGMDVTENPGVKIGNPVDIEGAPAAQAGGSGGPQPLSSAGNHSSGSFVNPYANGGGNSMSKAGGAVARPRARVIKKGDVKTWNNDRGSGKLFSIDLLDASGMDIRATFFKEAVDRFEPLLEEGGCYYFSGGKLKVANSQYNTCKCSHEITFDQNSEIVAVPDESSGEIQQNIFEFKKINEIELCEERSQVDVCAVVVSVGEVSEFVSKKSGKEMVKSEVTICDDSNCEIRVTLWGDQARKAEDKFQGNPVVAFKKLSVSDFGGKTLSASFSSSIVVSPKIKEAQELASWYEHGGNNQTMKGLSSMGGGGGGSRDTFESRKYVSSIKDDQLGYNEKPDWINFKTTINFIKTDKEGGPWYPACINKNDPCKQRCKVTETGDGNWMCDRCGQTSNECKRRYILSLTAMDNTSMSWFSMFDECATQLLGEQNSADELYKMIEQGDQDRFEAVFSDVLFSEWIMTAMVKNEQVNDEQRLKCTVNRMTKVDYQEESKNLLSAIQNIAAQ